VAVTHTFVLAIAMVALLCLPAIVALILCADGLYARASAALVARRAARRQARALDALDRTIGPMPGMRSLTAAAEPDDERPTIEQIAADLHRLGHQRLGVATRSQVWQTAVTRAYDEQLRLACRCLGVAEHLGGLNGVDLEIERLRVEGELLASGLQLPTADSHRRREQR
jgi:hypothetical protein